MQLTELTVDVPLAVNAVQKKPAALKKAAQQVKITVKIPMFTNGAKLEKGQQICIRE